MKLEEKQLEICNHDDISIKKACCIFKSSVGLIECACAGYPEVICENPNCQGIDDYEIDDIFDKLIGGGSDCE